VRMHRHRSVDLLIAGLAHTTGATVAIARKLTGVPMLTIVHGEELAEAEASRIGETCVKATFRASDRIVAVSGATRNAVLRLGGRPDATFVVPPAIDAADYLAASTPDGRHTGRTKLGIDGRIVVTVARLLTRKGHDTVLRAVYALGDDFSDVHYVVVGQGDQGPLRQLSEALGLTDRLTILDSLSKQDLIDVYAAADVFAMLSRPGHQGEVDGFGIVYLEAAACGLPCVAGNLGGCPDAIDDGVTGLLVDPTDPVAAAGALRRLLDEPTFARAMGARGQDRVVREFSRDRSQAEMMAIIDGLQGART
jgi:phosphatidylinositol alpha-1,6-mannosyltransferase